MPVKIHPSWQAALGEEFDRLYFRNLVSEVKREYAAGTCYPPGSLIFNAFDRCPLPSVKVVILGQDPYHGEGQAHGLCFSVQDGITLPPSLRNIYKEISSDLGITPPQSGNLTRWADQGVLLLNSVLTVRAHTPGSHAGMGWETFTDAVVAHLSRECDHLVFMLWGAYAQRKGAMIDRQRHLVLTAAHPSPMSARNGWFGCRHFSQANAYLRQIGKDEIQW